MKILKLVGKYRQEVEVKDGDCQFKNCLVVSDCNSPGKFTCRVRDTQGCPQTPEEGKP